MKRYLKELNVEELLKVYEKNKKLQNELWRDYENMQMDLQYSDSRWLLPDNCSRYYDIHNYYSSFYLTIKDGVKFMENIDLNNLLDYEIIEKKDIANFNRVYNYYNHCNYGTDKYFENEEKIEEIATKVLKAIEKYLHYYEDFSEEDVINYFTDEACLQGYEEYYIDENFILYQDIVMCYA